MIVNRQRRVPVSIKPLQEFYERVRGELDFPARSRYGSIDQRCRHGAAEPDIPEQARPYGRAFVSREYRGTIAKWGLCRRYCDFARNGASECAPLLPDALPIELRILMLHGMLHLAGFDHEADGGEMNRREERLRRRLGIL